MPCLPVCLHPWSTLSTLKLGRVVWYETGDSSDQQHYEHAVFEVQYPSALPIARTKIPSTKYMYCVKYTVPSDWYLFLFLFSFFLSFFPLSFSSFSLRSVRSQWCYLVIILFIIRLRDFGVGVPNKSNSWACLLPVSNPSSLGCSSE